MNYYSLFFDTVINIAGYFILVSCLSLFLHEKKINKTFKSAVICTVWFVIWLINTFGNSVNLNTFISFAGYMLICLLIYRGSVAKKILSTVFVMALSILCEGIVFLIMQKITIIPFNYTLGSAFSVLLYFLFVIFLNRFYNMRSSTPMPFHIYFAFIIILVGSVVVCDLLVNLGNKNENLTMLAMGILCLINMLIYYMMDKTNQMYQQVLQQEAISQQNEFYMQQIALTKEASNRVNALQHDFKNHCQTVAYYLDCKQPDKASEYVLGLYNMVIPRNQYINSTNIAVDSSINFYLSKAAKLNTKLSLSIAVPPDIFVSDLDISITLGNLLSNAIEALEKLQDDAERKLSVSILYKMSTLYLEIKNTFSGSLKKIDKVTFKSTKKDSRNHGYGLSNVNEVVEKYDGISSFTTDGNWFIVNITLFSEKKNSQLQE